MFTAAGLEFAGYYPRVAQSNFMQEIYINGANGYHNEYALINVLRQSGNSAETGYAGISAQVREMLQDGWSFTFSTSSTASNHAMTVFGFDFDDETGLIDKFYYSDNNDKNISKDKAFELDIYQGGTSGYDVPLMHAQTYGKIEYLYALRCTGIIFTDYDVKVGRNIVDQDQDVFSHYCNLIVDGADDFRLQYDLRDANADDSPVTPYIVKIVDEFQSEEMTNQKATTGDMRLRGGRVTLVEGVGEYDGGGSVEGTIYFEDSLSAGTETIQEANRTLKVDRTAKIAGEISLGATKGTNTLEVTQGNTASFGMLTGIGSLEKTGAGTLLNDGTIASGITLTVKEGLLKGSGTFAGVTVDGGTLVVGNSPGRQEYLGTLSVKAGDIIFSVDGWESPANEEQVGWGSGTYSNIVMNGNALTFADGVSLEFAVGGSALTTLLSGTGGSFSLNLATEIGNTQYFTSTLLEMLAKETIFYVANEPGATIVNDSGLNAGENLNTRITDLVYSLKDNTILCVSGVFMQDTPPVPEPAAGTMSLLALCALAARRRKR